MNISEFLSGELAYLPYRISIGLVYTDELPQANDDNCFYQPYKSQRTVDRYWIPWTKDIGVWIGTDGLEAELIVRKDAEPIEVGGALTIGLTSVIAGASLNLQKYVAIHSNSVSFQGQAVAFVGTSGRGKSTLSTFCACQGEGFVTDDVLVVDADRLVYPGNPRIKLYTHTAASLGLKNPIKTEYKAFFEPSTVGSFLHAQPIPLGIIYLLEINNEDLNIYSKSLSPGEAVFELLKHSYYASALVPHSPGLLNAYAHLVKQVPVKQLYYPRNFETLPQVYDFIQKEIATIPVLT
jgi:hypothetical protein